MSEGNLSLEMDAVQPGSPDYPIVPPSAIESTSTVTPVTTSKRNGTHLEEPPRKKQKRNKPTLSCEECVERKTKVGSFSHILSKSFSLSIFANQRQTHFYIFTCTMSYLDCFLCYICIAVAISSVQEFQSEDLHSSFTICCQVAKQYLYPQSMRTSCSMKDFENQKAAQGLLPIHQEKHCSVFPRSLIS